MNSKSVQQVHEHEYAIDFDNVKIAERENNHHKRLFLEMWHSLRDSDGEDVHINISSIYNPFLLICSVSHTTPLFSYVGHLIMWDRIYLLLQF